MKDQRSIRRDQRSIPANHLLADEAGERQAIEHGLEVVPHADAERDTVGNTRKSSHFCTTPACR